MLHLIKYVVQGTETGEIQHWGVLSHAQQQVSAAPFVVLFVKRTSTNTKPAENGATLLQCSGQTAVQM